MAKWWTYICWKKVQILFSGLTVTVFWVSVLLSPVGSNSWAENAQINKRPPGEVSFQRLEGRWVRPDGGYVLELRTIKRDGSVTAAYFNPKPIKVFRAEASLKGGGTHLFIELRDANYPGSTYNLLYDPMSDRLKGTYFQAVERLSFDIEFVRAK
jgi:hypothetical protein